MLVFNGCIKSQMQCLVFVVALPSENPMTCVRKSTETRVSSKEAPESSASPGKSCGKIWLWESQSRRPEDEDSHREGDSPTNGHIDRAVDGEYILYQFFLNNTSTYCTYGFQQQLMIQETDAHQLGDSLPKLQTIVFCSKWMDNGFMNPEKQLFIYYHLFMLIFIYIYIYSPVQVESMLP